MAARPPPLSPITTTHVAARSSSRVFLSLPPACGTAHWRSDANFFTPSAPRRIPALRSGDRSLVRSGTYAPPRTFGATDGIRGPRERKSNAFFAVVSAYIMDNTVTPLRAISVPTLHTLSPITPDRHR